MKTPEWRAKPANPEAARELGRTCGVGPAVGQLLLHRGIFTIEDAKEFLDPRLSGLTYPDGMADREVAAERIARAIRARERIVVFGDYDVDGTTSATILAEIIDALGGDVTAMLARRFEGGYGFSQQALDRALEARPTLIVTCDCGSSDHERIAAAAAKGVDVVVIDHHLVPAEPLPALAFLNPHRPDCGFPYKGLCSAGLALSIGAALRKVMSSDLDVRRWLDLVALGTVADVAPLNGDNRILVRAGLVRVGDPDGRPGLVALREVAQMKAGNVTAQDVSFRLAPRLNAAGRLGDPAVTLALLRSRSPVEARQLAASIEQINLERRSIEKQVTTAAEAQAREIYGDAPAHGIVVAGEGWHRGVVGISAARLVDIFRVPAIVIGIDGGMGHGSGRSPKGFPLYDAVKDASASLHVFGGHHAAMGLSVEAGNVARFREDFAAAAARIAFVPSTGDLDIDVVLDGATFPIPEASDLNRFEPTGEGNPEPMFAIHDATVSKVTAVGEGRAHLKLELRAGGRTLSAFGYGLGDKAGAIGSKVSIAGPVRPDTWRGGGAVEIRIVDIRT